MTDDHLDRETSVSAEVTDTGIKATAKSRFVAALDRLGGAVVDNLNARIEGSTDRKRAKTKGEVTLIENIVEYGVQQLGASPEFAERAFNTHFRKVLAAQKNKDHVLLEARRDLEENPPTEDVEGDISEDFFARFEPYAEAASSEGLRQLFGRILAGEIRKPGRISPSTLHFVSMLDAEAAALIESIAALVISESQIPATVAKEMFSFSQLKTLEDLGFLSVGAFGYSWNFTVPDTKSAALMLGKVGLVIAFSSSGQKTMSSFLLTRAARELMQCIEVPRNIAKICEAFGELGATEARIGTIAVDPNGNEAVYNATPIWSKAKK